MIMTIMKVIVLIDDGVGTTMMTNNNTGITLLPSINTLIARGMFVLKMDGEDTEDGC